MGLAFVPVSLAAEPNHAAVAPGGGVEVLASSAANEVEAWVRKTADNQGLPFLIIDKVSAQVLVFDPQGRRLGAAPALLGLARGDVSPPGIGHRPLSAITAEERITPAGRFLASIGENISGKGILWIDYDAALSLHPVVTTRAADRRLERLATAAPDDNRISYGCVNVPVRFYDEIVQTTFKGTMGVVYILPESRSPAEVFFAVPKGVAPLSSAAHREHALAPEASSPPSTSPGKPPTQ
ncbi:L,D-transpeptidase [Caulobacter sp.]|uniref:L,D-transpeptidase n=1 Tax=Caulobacter sp. TaxID=78 RepID=UPI003BB1D3A6